MARWLAVVACLVLLGTASVYCMHRRQSSLLPSDLISAKEAPATIADCNIVNIWSQNKSITDGLWTACSNCSAYVNCFWCPEESTSSKRVPSLIL